MSSAEPIEPPATQELSNLADQPSASRKSYRRKYRKTMVSFEEKMRESNALFKEEQRILDISQRLAEQTDQLLQLLLDLNSCPQIPQRLRYDLKARGDHPMPDADSKPTISEEDGHGELHRARKQLENKEITIARYREIEEGLLKAPDFTPSRSYSTLLSVAPPPNQSMERADSGNGPSSGFLTTKQEEQYLQGLDTYCVGGSMNPRPHAAHNLGNRNAEKTTERERETQLKNPVSVYNWLRKHQPQVFLQDNEPSTEKPPRATGSRSSTRKSANKEALKQEQDYYDDDGIAMDLGSSSRGKRKRDDDGGWRPKGGASRGNKRRREQRDEPGRGKRGKKMSMDAR